ncbi:MAG: VOC family protein [Acidimicrobiales bacterium]
MIDRIHLDHVALAFERRTDAWPRYGGELPGRYIAGGTGNGFANYQLEYANGMRLEVLEPAEVERNDFLRRFLDRSGAGPHHLTFKVDDIKGAIRAVEGAGYQPVGVNIEFPGWKELFLHPKEMPGIVIQIAQSAGEGWAATPPVGFPAPRTADAATLERVVHAAADMDQALRVFRDLLGGVEEANDGSTVDLAWPGAGRIRLVSGPSVAPWVGGQAGRLHHLAFVTDDPAALADARRLGESDIWEVLPEHNHGTRLRLRSSAT